MFLRTSCSGRSFVCRRARGGSHSPLTLAIVEHGGCANHGRHPDAARTGTRPDREDQSAGERGRAVSVACPAPDSALPRAGASPANSALPPPGRRPELRGSRIPDTPRDACGALVRRPAGGLESECSWPARCGNWDRAASAWRKATGVASRHDSPGDARLDERVHLRRRLLQFRSRQLMARKGYTDAELPTAETIRVKLNALGYTLTRVAKAHPASP
jgi:hypothetical protein